MWWLFRAEGAGMAIFGPGKSSGPEDFSPGPGVRTHSQFWLVTRNGWWVHPDVFPEFSADAGISQDHLAQVLAFYE